ncbi:MAG: hypothetical protein V2J26_03805 [Pacificimonas sp.]|jgi:hypothetical protein|nr:hypothetical protein [Pacificimonas sp.]
MSQKVPKTSNITAAETLVRGTLVWHNHSCLPTRLDNRVFFAQLREVHARADVLSVNAGFGPSTAAEHLAMIVGLAAQIKQGAVWCRLVHTIADIEAARASATSARLRPPANTGRLSEPETDHVSAFAAVRFSIMSAAKSKAPDRPDRG